MAPSLFGDASGRERWSTASRHAHRSVRVSRSSDLAPALERSLAHDGVSLIEVIVDSSVPLLYAQKS